MRRTRYAIPIAAIMLALVAPSGNGLAQTGGSVITAGPIVAGGLPVQPFGMTMGFGMGFGIDGVKGAPFSAEEINESTQVLNDGNRIVRKITAKVYRDSEGRTRREQAVQTPFGPESPDDVPRFVTISDPGARAHYTLDSRTKTAQKMLFPSPERIPASGKIGVLSPNLSTVPPQVSNRVARPMERSPATSESLGTETIEGFEAQGTRSTMTIPAGQVGNERPIEIVTEQWYSPALHMMVRSKRNDPRMGESVTRLTNISLEEPDPSLFEIPPDYTVEERQPVGGFFSKPSNTQQDH